MEFDTASESARMVEEKEYTLVFVFKGTQVLLGLKKRGFGAGNLP